MDEFTGAYGDERRAAAVARLHEAMVERRTVVVRKLGGDRKGEVSAHLALASPRVTAPETIACLARRTGEAASGRRVAVAQDTTEVSFPGRASRGLGPAGRLGTAPGFFVHGMGEGALSPDVAVDTETEAVLGLVAAEIWTRDVRDGGSGVSDRRRRVLADKESRRMGKAVLCPGWPWPKRRPSGWTRRRRWSWSAAARATSTRSSPVAPNASTSWCAPPRTALWKRAGVCSPPPRPGRCWAATRSRCRRADPATAAEWPGSRCAPARSRCVTPATPGRKATRRPRGLGWSRRSRTARRPRSRLRGFALRDGSLRDGVAPLHWRLLTTLPAGTGAEAAEAVRFYRLRWRIEQTWRTLKGEGLRIEEAQTHTPHRLLNLAALALGAAVRVIQLVDARDGGPRPASDVADGGQIAAAVALCPTLEGGTERQRNPHLPGSLAWLSWITARLGGWNCYGKPPGPKTMHDGWRRFAAIAEGYALSRMATHDACIP